MILSRLATTLGATACAVLIGLASSASAATLAPAGPPPNPGAQAAGAAGASVANVITQASLEDLFVAVTPCRVADTRGGGGILSGTRTFYVAGTYGFAPQGGRSGGCGIPLGASAVATNVTTTLSAGGGYLTGYATGGSLPLSNFISFSQAGNVTANPVLPLAPGSGKQLTIKTSRTTHVIIDVTGYYTHQMQGLIYTGSSTTPGSGFVYSGSPRLLSVTWISVGIADVTVDRDVTYCTPEAGGYYDSTYYADAKAFNQNKVRVYTWYLNSTTHLPTPINNYVYLTVHC